MCVRAGSVAHPRNYAHWSAFRILAAWPHPPKPLTPNVGVTAATNLLFGHWPMKIERFADHQEAREALVLSVAGVTAIMLTAYLLLMILY
jgi:hypothetical protein